MINYLIRRIIYIIPTLIAISIVVFIVINLPPGDFLTSYVNQLRQSGLEVDASQVAALERRYGLDRSIVGQYIIWITNFVQGDFGLSFQENRPVIDLIKERIGFTALIALSTVLFQWIMAIPIGIYSAVKQYSITDYIFTLGGFIGLAMPNFLLALIIMYIAYAFFDTSVTGLISSQYMGQPWDLPKILDMLNNLWVPVVVIGTAGAAGLIRIMRGQMLDELGKPYVQTARAKGLYEFVVVLKHATRIAINPLVSTVGWILPQIIAGGTIVGIVLGLPTLGPLLLRSLRFQDMFLAGSILMCQGILIIIGTLISDVLLAISDPRIRYD